MKTVLFNGSPREGNTKFAIDLIKAGIDENIDDAETEIIDLSDRNINCCTGCDICISNKGICVFNDDMRSIIESVRNADMIIFGSPVYWWGITAQLKTVIDRLYALIGKPGKTEKKIGLLVIGQDSLDGPQYSLISKQFGCICEHLGWEMVFDKAISAYEPEDIKNNEEESTALKELWQKI